MKKWDELPEYIKNDAVGQYYDILIQHKKGLFVKRIFDLLTAGILFIILLPVFFILGILIKADSPGPIFFRQIRVTTNGKKFRIYKFRTMINNAEKIGTQVTTKQDIRITRVGKIIRKCRLDELPQLLNIIKGDMTFVGTRPEVEKYVACYTDEMKATLLLPAGVTSMASIEYKDEDKLLDNASNVDEVYIKQVLPEKMKYNLKAIREFSFWGEIKVIFETILAVIK